MIRVFKEADSGFSSMGTKGNIAGLRWENPPGESTLDDPFLRFYLKQPPPVLISTPLASSVVCYLIFDEDRGFLFSGIHLSLLVTARKKCRMLMTSIARL